MATPRLSPVVLLTHLPPDVTKEQLRQWWIRSTSSTTTTTGILRGAAANIQIILLPSVALFIFPQNEMAIRFVAAMNQRANNNNNTIINKNMKPDEEENTHPAEAATTASSFSQISVSWVPAALSPGGAIVPLPPAVTDPVHAQDYCQALSREWKLCVEPAPATRERSDTTPTNTTTIAPMKMEIDSEITNTNSDDPNSTTTRDILDILDHNVMHDSMEETSPLQIPQIAQWVQQFRYKLEQIQGSKALNRKQLVQDKLQQRIQQLKQQQLTNQPPEIRGSSTSLPTQPRGISNQPAWMTTNASTEEAPPPPPSKKVKLEESSSQSTKSLQEFIQERLTFYLGSNDETLLNFILQNHNRPDQLMQELTEVLEQDAPKLVQDIQEFQTQQ